MDEDFAISVHNCVLALNYFPDCLLSMKQVYRIFECSWVCMMFMG